jgi:hypothetical protein
LIVKCSFLILVDDLIHVFFRSLRGNFTFSSGLVFFFLFCLRNSKTYLRQLEFLQCVFHFLLLKIFTVFTANNVFTRFWVSSNTYSTFYNLYHISQPHLYAFTTLFDNFITFSYLLQPFYRLLELSYYN